jgi:hypothetical protein
MIEQIIYDYLKTSLSGDEIPVYMERPATPPSCYVLIEKTGGGEDNHIQRATVAVQSINTSLLNTAVLNEKVKEFMRAAISLDKIAKVECNSDYNFTDSSTKTYRYQAIFDIKYYL